MKVDIACSLGPHEPPSDYKKKKLSQFTLKDLSID
jgi:hypothetical protein